MEKDSVENDRQQDEVMEEAISETGISDLPPPIPEKIPQVSASPPPLPPRPKPAEPQIARSLPPIPTQSVLPDLPEPPPPPCQSATGDVKEEWAQAVTRTATLQELSENIELLPAVIRFLDGYYGQISRFPLSAGDYFKINFLKQSNILNIQDIGRRNYVVPLTSTMKLGLLPDNSEYSTAPIPIAAILAMKKLPHVICVVNAGKDKKEKIVSEGDLLIVQQKKQKGLKCLNVNTHSDVLIKKSFTGTFTLDPNTTKMHPLELAQHLPSVFPCRARVYQTQSYIEPETSSALSGKVVTLKGCTTEMCLVAREVHTSSSLEGRLVYFPVHGNLCSVHVHILDIDGKQQLQDDAYKLLQNFDPTVGVTYADVQSDAAFDIQQFLYQDVRPDMKNAEMKLLTSEALNRESPQKNEERVSIRSSASQAKEVSQKANNAPCDTDKTLKQPTSESESDSQEYELIDPSLLKAQPAVKPRRELSLHSLPTPPLPVPRKGKPGVRQPPTSTVEPESEYMTIPETPPPSTVGTKPAIKPRPRTTVVPVAQSSPFPQPLLLPLGSAGGYTILNPSLHCSTSDEQQYTTITTRLPQSSPYPPLPRPRRSILVSEQTSEENRAFLKTMTPAQVMCQYLLMSSILTN